MKQIDCKGLPCPQPVLETRKILDGEQPEQLTVVVDNEPARDNVTRFFESRGYTVQAAPSGEGFWAVTGSRGAAAANTGDCPECRIMSQAEIQAAGRKTCVLLTTETLGHGDDILGGKLMLNFLATLPEMGDELWRVVLLNGGVKLTAEGNPCLEKLQALEQSGITILVCGTCLEFFGLLEAKRVGETTNMLDVVTSLQLADKVIRP